MSEKAETPTSGELLEACGGDAWALRALWRESVDGGHGAPEPPWCAAVLTSHRGGPLPTVVVSRRAEVVIVHEASYIDRREALRRLPAGDPSVVVNAAWDPNIMAITRKVFESWLKRGVVRLPQSVELQAEYLRPGRLSLLVATLYVCLNFNDAGLDRPIRLEHEHGDRRWEVALQ